MADAALESALFSFDDADASLERMPIAARRALDLSGWRVALDAWRAMPYDGRRRVTLAGVPEIIDPFVVEEAVRRAGNSAMRVRPAADPDPGRPPTDLATALEPGRSLDPRTWTNLRALERYALLHALRHAPDRAYLHDVFDEVVPHRPTSPPTPAPRVFGRSSLPPSTLAASEQQVMHRSVRADAGPMTLSERPAAIPSPPKMPTDVPAPVSTHLTSAGEVHMVDVGQKPVTARRAVAAAAVRMRPETLARVARREVDKGEVLATARLAGIMAAKRTPDLIPLCHHVALTRVEVHLDLDLPGHRVLITAVAEAHDRTGVEMEAMVAASVASLTVYDMLKGTDRDIVVESVRLLEKSGGRTGPWPREEP